MHVIARGRRGRAAIAAGLALGLTGCAGYDDKTVKRAGTAAAVGAVTGAVIGSFGANMGKGLLAGAAIGAAGGYVYDQIKKDN
jgi:uncharacterized protein YqgC (DUF456 family)